MLYLYGVDQNVHVNVGMSVCVALCVGYYDQVIRYSLKIKWIGEMGRRFVATAKPKKDPAEVLGAVNSAGMMNGGH